MAFDPAELFFIGIFLFVIPFDIARL